MRVTLVAPLDIPSLEEALDPSFREVAKLQPRSNGTGPGILAQALITAGHTVQIVTHTRGQSQLELAGDQLSVLRVDSRRRQRQQLADCWGHEISAMAESIRAQQADVVHAHWIYEWALAATRANAPMIATTHDAPLTVLRYRRDIYGAVRATMPYRFRALKPSSILTAVSPYLRDTYRRQTANRTPITVIPNIAPKPRQTTVKNPTPLLVEIADASRRKNVRGLLRAFAHVHRQHPTTELAIVGSGLSHDDEIARWARASGLSVGVTFRGILSRAEVQTLLDKAWIHPHASIEESFGQTLTEAMASRTICIVGARTGASEWIVAGGEAGVVTDVRDPVKFAQSISRVIDQYVPDNPLVDRATQYISTNFSAQTVVGEYEALYRKAQRV